MMRAAVREVLASPSFREAASATSGQLAGIDGAKNAADEIEQLLSKSLKKAS